MTPPREETYPPAVMEAIARGDTTALLIEVYKATSHTAEKVLEHHRAIRDHGGELAAHDRRLRKLEDLESSRRSAQPLLNASQRTEADAIMEALRKVSEDALAREKAAIARDEQSRINTEKADASATRNARLATLRTIVLLVVFAASAWLRNR